MPCRSVVLLACCVLCIPFTGIAAQAEQHGGVVLRTGQTLRVRLADGQRFEAKLVGVDSNPLVLRFVQAPLGVPISSINSLWLRRRGTGRGALIGGIVVGAASFAFLALVCNAFSEGNGCESWGAVAGLTLVGGGAGALVGAGIGSLFTRWQRLDPQRVTISLGVGNLGVRAGARIRF